MTIQRYMISPALGLTKSHNGNLCLFTDHEADKAAAVAEKDEQLRVCKLRWESKANLAIALERELAAKEAEIAAWKAIVLEAIENDEPGPYGERADWYRKAVALREALQPATAPEKPKTDLHYCDRCDGCGWYEGGPTLQTRCEDCNGTGVIDRLRPATAGKEGEA